MALVQSFERAHYLMHWVDSRTRVLEAFIEQVERDGRKTKVTGRIVSGERVIVEASVLFVQAA